MRSPSYAWVDALRIVAIFLVVLLHVSARSLYQWSEISFTQWFLANTFDSISRVCVPLFVMLSGALLLEKNESFKDFFSKRVRRIVLPWIFWTGIYIGWAIFFRGEHIANFGELKRLVIETFFGGFWFLVMLVGLYILTPLWRVFVRHARNNEFLFFFVLWFLTASFSPLLWQYSGYFVLGHWLFKMRNQRFLEWSTRTFALVIIGGISLTLFGTLYLTLKDNHFNELLYDFVSPGQVLASVGIFLWFCQRKFAPSSQFVSQLAGASFGIYLLHIIILESILYVVKDLPIFILTIFVYLTTAFCIFVVRKNWLGRQIT